MTDLRRQTALPAIPHRAPDSHKGTYGRVVTLAGSRGMVGAACLAAQAALRSGAGLSVLAVPASIASIAAAKLTCEMVEALPESPDGTFDGAACEPALALCAEAQAVAIGPGIRTGAATAAWLERLLPRLSAPMVVDADALNLLAAHPAWLGTMRAPAVLTPHPGEMSRLADKTTVQVQAAREETVVDFARRHGKIVVLKGHGTIVTDGASIYVNTTGNPGMATGGTGDVLTGVIAGLIARGLAPFDAAVLGVYLHGLAGDLAAAEVGEESLIATDVLERLPRAFRTLAGK